MATYGTDLTTFTNAESGTWVELTPYALGSPPVADGENFIEGSDCMSCILGNKSGLGFSDCFDYGSDASGLFSADDVVLIWGYFAVGTDLYTYANGGMRFAAFDSLTVGDSWAISGNDRTPHPYGGWYNYAIDPTQTATYTDGGGSAGAWRYFGLIVGITLKIAKGSPLAVDAIRYGRGEIYCTGTGCEFTTMAEYNDYNQASPHPNSGDSDGYNRYGLFQAKGGGTYLWKGLISFGQSGTSATFSDSNKSITIDDSPHVYTAFNKIEVHHSGTSVTWTNVSFTSIGTISPGQFEMIDNATVALASCTFNNMNTFIFDTNATLTNCVFNGCAQIIQSGATFTGCAVDGSTAGIAMVVDDISEITNTDFTSTGTGYAIEGFAVAGDYDLVGITFNDYAVSDGSTGNEAVHVLATSGIVNLNVSGGGTSNFSIHSEGATVNIIAGAVTLGVTVTDISTGAFVVGARVFVTPANGDNFPFEDSVTITRSVNTATVTGHTAHGLATSDKVYIKGANESDYNGVFEITIINDDSYSYTVPNTPDTPATGTITSTYVIIEGITNSSGYISKVRTYSVDQLITGRVRRATTGTLYKTSPITGTIDAENGLPINIQLIPDE